MAAKTRLMSLPALRRLRWTWLRKTSQVAALLIFLALFVASRRGSWRPDVVNLPMRLDPLAMLAETLASRTILSGSLLALLTILLSLLAGRAWCGWLCPLGTTLDIFNFWKKKRKNQPQIPETWRRGKYLLLLAILFSALFTNLTLLIFDPLTLVFRTLSVSIWPALDQALTVIESAMYQVPWLRGLLEVLDRSLRPGIFPSEPVFYRETILYAAIFLLVIGLNMLAPRFWCRYLCPLGGMLGLFSKTALLQRQVGDSCKACTICTQTCPMGTIDPQRNYASDPGECTLCMDCLENCPRRGTSFRTAFYKPNWNTYDPGRREALLAIGTAVAGITLFRSSLFARRTSATLLRPPGGAENDLTTKCIRCGECLRACPTSGLQPAQGEAGFEGWMTPVLVPRLGYCDYSCHACGMVCPVQAIPPMNLEEKRSQVIGNAYIDTDRCIAWADQTDCIVCEEMCPLPEKAIWLEAHTITLRDGEQVIVNLPHVDRTTCIGCGICEYKCPVGGEAAIRIFTARDSVTG